MKKMLLVVVLALMGCVTAAQRADIEFDSYKATLPEPGADYGSYPDGYQAAIVAYMQESLKDPDSAKYSDFSVPRQEHVIENRKTLYGYSVCVFVNAKNSYGGYTGKQRYWFFFRSGAIVRVQKVEGYLGTLIYRGRAVNCEDGPTP